ncbi:hypothetical protein NC651_018758 [Populus alba x Populus x berolinensis]|nr:hypothetical protein NC651_018758 [Populus alba x Populus x berolinensis]
MFSFVTIIDDIYDVYGTLDALQLFTDAVERRDVHSINDLPHYMKLCFLALCNTINEIAYENLKEKEENILPYLTKAKLYSGFKFSKTGLSVGNCFTYIRIFILKIQTGSFSLTTQKLYRNPLTRILHGTPNDSAGRKCSNSKHRKCYRRSAGIMITYRQ